MTHHEALLVLNAMPGMSGEAIQRLLTVFESPEELLSASAEELLKEGLNQNLVTNIIHFPKDKFLEAEYNLLQQKGIEVIGIYDEDYPSLLKSIPHAPIVLYIKGNRELLNSPAIAMVGARKASHYGLKIAHEFASRFAQAGINVISGMALGIDTASHQGCLKAKGKTIAVLGSGLNFIYPKENIRLFEEIAQKGLVISEFAMGMQPFTYNFPRRNRIVSGLSLATVVIEAAEKSGSLITADYALQQQRDVFAVPGNIDSVYSGGTNRLIKEGAKIALNPLEVLEELGLTIKQQLEQEKAQEKPHVQVPLEQYKVYELIQHQPIHIDDIAISCQQSIGEISAHMIHLELSGAIKQLPGQFYVRI